MKKAYNDKGEYLGRIVLDGEYFHSHFNGSVLLDVTDSEVIKNGWKFKYWSKIQQLLDLFDIDRLRTVVNDDAYYFWLFKNDIKRIETKESNLKLIGIE